MEKEDKQIKYGGCIDVMANFRADRLELDGCGVSGVGGMR